MLFNEDTVTALSNFLDFPSWRCFMLTSKTIYIFCKSSKVRRPSVEVCIRKDCLFSRAHTAKVFPKYCRTPEDIDEVFKHDVGWFGKYTNGYSWCRGTIVSINKEIGHCLKDDNNVDDPVDPELDDDPTWWGHYESPREIVEILKKRPVDGILSEVKEDVLVLTDPNDYSKIIAELEYVERIGKSRGIEFVWI